MTETGRKASRWRWIAAAALAGVLVACAWLVQNGSCASTGECQIGPTIGVTGAWVVTVLGAIFVIYAGMRAFRQTT